MTTTRTTQETVLTVSEHIDAKGLAHWTVRNGHAIVATHDEPRWMGMWDTDKLRKAVANTLNVPMTAVQFQIGHGHTVAARFMTVES